MDAEYQLRAVTVPIPFLPADQIGVVDLIAAKMDAAAASMSEYLSRSLWPAIPWYSRIRYRLSDTWLVLIGRRIAIHPSEMRPLSYDEDEDA